MVGFEPRTFAVRGAVVTSRIMAPETLKKLNFLPEAAKRCFVELAIQIQKAGKNEI